MVQVPDFGDRFWVYQIVDQRTDSFAHLGKMYGSKPGMGPDRAGEIWVRAVSDGAPVRVSQNGGIAPMWSHDGRELFFREGRKVMAASFHAGAVPSFDQPVLLFDGPFRSGDGSYDVAADGRFILIPIPSGPSRAPGSIVVVQNWTEELKRLVPVN